MILTLKCRFCDTITGHIEVPEGKPVPPIDIADIRCTTHEQEFGSYQDMEQKYQAEFGQDLSQFKIFVQKVGYKKAAFDAEVEKIKKQK